MAIIFDSHVDRGTAEDIENSQYAHYFICCLSKIVEVRGKISFASGNAITVLAFILLIRFITCKDHTSTF